MSQSTNLEDNNKKDNVFIVINNTNNEITTNNISADVDIDSKNQALMKNTNDNISNPFISPPSTPENGGNSFSNDSGNDNTSEVKEKIVNINILNPNENTTSLDINTNDNSLNNQNCNDNKNSTKQFNLNSLDDDETGNTSKTSTKKIVKTAITFDLDKKERVVKESENSVEENENKEDDNKVSSYCPVCKAKASFMCSSCGPVIFYCSQSCQIAHWPEHRLVCKGVKKNKGKTIVEHKKTESIFGEIIDPTIGSNLVVGTRNVAQLINLKRSRTESNKTKKNSVFSNRKSTTSNIDQIEEEEEEEEEEEMEDEEFEKEAITSKTDLLSNDKQENKVSPLLNIKTDNKYLDKEKIKNSDDDLYNPLFQSDSPESKNDADISVENSSGIPHKKKSPNENDNSDNNANNDNNGNKKTKKSRRKSVSDFLAKASEDEEFIEDLKFYIQQIFLIIKPVLLCILLTILWVKLTNQDNAKHSYKRYILNKTPNVNSTVKQENDSAGDFKNALFLLLRIILTTVIIVVLFVFSCMKTLTSIFIMMVTLLLSAVSYYLVYKIANVHDIPIDNVTVSIVTWNIAVVGVIVIFWKGPLSVQQYYLVYISSVMAFSLSEIMTSYVTLIFLAVLAIWDLIAVLTPFGPLRLLLKYSEENNQEIPALLYNLMVTLMAAPPSIKIRDKKEKDNEEDNQIEETKSSDKRISSTANKISEGHELENNTSFSGEILNMFNMKTVSSPPTSPKISNMIPSSPKQFNMIPSSPKQSTAMSSISIRQSNILSNSSSQKHNSRPLSLSSNSSGTLTRKPNPNLKRYPSNSSISISGSRRYSRPHSSYRPHLSPGSISDENASTANLFQDSNNSYGSLKRSNSKTSTLSYLSNDSKKKIIEKKYLHTPGDTRKISISRSPSELRINRNLSHANSLSRSSRSSRIYTSMSNDMDSSFISDESSSYFSPSNASFSSAVPLMSQRRSQNMSNNSYSHHSSSHRHGHHGHGHSHHGHSHSQIHSHNHGHSHHHHHNDRSTASSPSSIHYKSSHKHNSYSGLGPSSDIFTRFEELGIVKKTSKKKDKKKSKKVKEKTERQKVEDQEEEAESTGIKLGLGDFVFYSVLVARAAMDDNDWLVTINCTIAVITGLTITIFLLAVLKKALPALPISIVFGLISYYISYHLITKFVHNGILFFYRFDLDTHTELYSIYTEIMNKYLSFHSELNIGKWYGGFAYF